MNEQLIVSETAPPQGALFDYSALDAETRIVVQQRAGEIKSLAKRVAQDIVEIGGKLAEVKDRLGDNGRFVAWLGGELNWAERTAYNYIAVYTKFARADFEISNIATSALYLLAAPSTPPAAIEMAREIAREGGKVTHTVAKTVVKQAKAAEQRAKGHLFEESTMSADDEVMCLCGCKASDHPDGDCKICSCEMFEEASADIQGAAVPVSQATMDSLKKGAPRDAQREGYARLREMDANAKAIETAWRKSKVHISFTYPPAQKGKRKALVMIQAEGCASHECLLSESEITFIGPALELLEDYKRKLPDLIAGKKAKEAREAILANREAIGRENAAKETARRTGQGTPFPTEHSKEEMERIAGFYCVREIEQGKPVKICHVLDQPFVVTAIYSSNSPEVELDVWPVLPLANVGEENVKDYKQASAEYNQQIRRLSQPMKGRLLVEVDYPDFSFENVKINCGSAKRPDWWVMVGPEMSFTTKQEAAAEPVIDWGSFPKEYSQDEINRMAGYCCPRKISEEKPVKICYVQSDQSTSGAPFVITGSLGSGKADKNYLSVWGMPAVRLQDYRGKGKTYATASRVNKRGEQFYKGVKVNAGTPKKPDWWVMVGSSVEFTVKIEADDFTADRCQVCHRIDGAHTPDCELGTAISYQVYLDFCRAQKLRSPASQARKLELSRERDEEVLAWMSEQNKAMAVANSKRG